MSRTPWLSVLIPVYNGARFLDEALASVLAQNDANVQVLVVDDGSSDDSLLIAKRYERHLDLNCLDVPRSGNWAVNTNIALGAATGEFTCFLHQDDRWEPDRLLSLRAALLQQPDAGWASSEAFFIDDHGQRIGRWRTPFSTYDAIKGTAYLKQPTRRQDVAANSCDRQAGQRPQSEPMAVTPGQKRHANIALQSQVCLHSQGAIVEMLLVQNVLAIAAPIFRTDLARAVGGLDCGLRYTADWDFWLKLAAIAPLAHVARPLVSFRVHSGSQTVQLAHQPEAFRQQLLTVYTRAASAAAARGQALSDETIKLAQLSIAMNSLIAAWSAGQPADLATALTAWRDLGLTKSRLFLQRSRLLERLYARRRLAVAAWRRRLLPQRQHHDLSALEGAKKRGPG